MRKVLMIGGAVLLLGGGMLFSARNETRKVGDRAPDFTLTDQDGASVKLSEFLGKKNVVLAFYIKAFTPGWTKELKAYQADIAKFEQAGTQVIGISVDSQSKNRAFANDLGVKFPVLSDESKNVSRKYGVLIPLVRLANRTTFIIDKEGIIQNIQKGGEAVDPENAQQACSVLEYRKK